MKWSPHSHHATLFVCGYLPSTFWFTLGKPLTKKRIGVHCACRTGYQGSKSQGVEIVPSFQYKFNFGLLFFFLWLSPCSLSSDKFITMHVISFLRANGHHGRWLLQHIKSTVRKTRDKHPLRFQSHTTVLSFREAWVLVFSVTRQWDILFGI